MQEPKRASEPAHPVCRKHTSAQEPPSAPKRHLGHRFKYDFHIRNDSCFARDQKNIVSRKPLGLLKYVDPSSTRRNAYIS